MPLNLNQFQTETSLYQSGGVLYYVINGVQYTLFPTNKVGALTNDGKGNLSWKPASGGNSPGGSFQDIQINNGEGGFYGDSNFVWDNLDQLLYINGIIVDGGGINSIDPINRLLYDSAGATQLTWGNGTSPSLSTDILTLGYLNSNFIIGDSEENSGINSDGTSVSQGDVFGNNNGSILQVDDNTQTVSWNKRNVSIGSVSYVYPAANAVGSLRNDGSGNLSWGNPGHTIFAPASTNTINLIDNQINIINPLGTIAALTIDTPLAVPSNNDTITVKFTQTVTAITWGTGISGGIATAVKGTTVVLTYDSLTNTWY